MTIYYVEKVVLQKQTRIYLDKNELIKYFNDEAKKLKKDWTMYTYLLTKQGILYSFDGPYVWIVLNW